MRQAVAVALLVSVAFYVRRSTIDETSSPAEGGQATDRRITIC
jgi:hypothetical protein